MRILVLLLLSLVFTIPGFVLMDHAGYSDPRMLRYGMLLTLGGMSLGPAIIFIFANRFVKGENRLFKEEIARRRTGPATTTPVQRQLKHSWTIRRYKSHPYFVLLFCLIGFITGNAMLFLGYFGNAQSFSSGNVHKERLELIIMGGAMGLVYFSALAFLLPKFFQGRWNQYWDSRLEQIDSKIKRLNEESALLSKPK